MKKSTLEEIRARFDGDVERFSNLETGQTAIMDAPLLLQLVAEAAAALTPQARELIDLGCGAGNWTLRLLAEFKKLAPAANLNCTLLDLSRPMLDRAAERVSAATGGQVRTVQNDLVHMTLPAESADVVVAASVLHHLRSAAEWETVFAKVYAALRPGGTFWISDLVCHDNPAVQEILWRRFGEYLEKNGGGGATGAAYRDKVFDYIGYEDTPRSLEYQLALLRKTGFRDAVVLHKNAVFAAFGAQR